MSASPAGYSGKPLYQKIGTKADMRVGTIGAPGHYGDLMSGAPAAHIVPLEPDDREAFDIVHLFCRDRASLDSSIARAFAAARDPGMVWVSWPKKASTLFVDLTEDGIRDAITGTGWVDVKVCAVDADWSGLKLLRRRT